MSGGGDGKILTVEPDDNRESRSDLSSEEEDDYEPGTGLGGGCCQRKTQFRWNTSRDLTLIREVGSAKPFLEQGKASQLCWGKVADVVNDLYDGDIDYLAAKRRLKLLLSDLGKRGFRNRYKYASDDEVAAIKAGLRTLKSVMEGNEEFPMGDPTQNSQAEDDDEQSVSESELLSSEVLLDGEMHATDDTDEVPIGDGGFAQVQQSSDSEESDDPGGDGPQRKKQFRWNVPRDLMLVREVESTKPFLEHGKESCLIWGRIADAVNAEYFGGIDYFAARRRFRLLMSDLEKPDFQTRYPSGNEEGALVIMAKLKGIRLMIRDFEKLSKDDGVNTLTSKKKAATRSIPKVAVITPVVLASKKSGHSSLRRIQFRWNAPRDLTLVMEVASQKPFLDFGKDAVQCWSRVAKAVNEAHSGTTDHVGAKRRFYLLLGDLGKPCFGSRYRSGYEEEVLAIVDGLRVLKTLIENDISTAETEREQLDKLNKSGTEQDDVGDIHTDRKIDPHSEMEDSTLKQQVYCVVSSCANTNNQMKEDLRFFSFPSDSTRQRQWIEAIGIPANIARLDTRICSDHFRTEDFLPDFSELVPELNLRKKRRLCTKAVPSLLLPTHSGNIIHTVGSEDMEINDGEKRSHDGDALDSREEPYSHSPRKKRKILQSPRSSSRTTLEPCLICSKKNTKINTELYFISGSNGFSPLNHQLWNTFVMRKILKLPVWKYAELLETAGSCVNPSDWFVVCNMCSETVNKILETQQEIMSLERKVTRLKISLEKKCMHSSDNGNVSEGMLNIRDEIGTHFKDSLKQPSLVQSVGNLEPKEEIPDIDFGSVLDDDNAEFVSEIPETSTQANRDFLMEADDDDSQVYSGEEEKMEDEDAHVGSSDEECIPEENISSKKEEKDLSEAIPADPLEHLDNEADSDYEFKPTSRVRKRSKGTKRKTINRHRKIHCQICVRKFNTHDVFLKHMKCHAKTKKLYNGGYDCFKCKAPYDSKHSLRNHFTRAHSLTLHNLWDVDMPQEEYTYTKQTKKEVLAKLSREQKVERQVVDCEHCTRKYYSKKVLERHLKLHKVSKKLHDGRLDCFQCKAPYTKVESLRVHLKNSHQLTLDKNWDGSTPQEHGIIEKSKPTITMPTTNEDGSEIYKCTRCDWEFKTKGGYEYHARSHETTPENQHCPKCRRPYPSQEALNKHLKQVHKIVDLSCICELCGFDARRPTVLKSHMIKHKIYEGSVDHSISTTHFVCTICKETFKTRRVLSIHRVNDHYEELGIDVLKCTEPDCSKVFLRKNGLLDHVAQRHKGTYRYQCEVCGHGTPSKYNLELHMQTHRKTQHVCEYCSATYQYTTGFRTHMLKHHPDKYEPKRVNFFQGVQVDKLEHEYGHGMLPMGTTGCKKVPKRELKCKYCDMQLPNKFTFKQHLKIAHADMYSFNCDLCERVYLSDQSLKLHKKLNHSAASNAVTCGWCLKTVPHRMKLYDHKHSCTKRPKGPDVPKIFVLEGGNPSHADASSTQPSAEDGN